MLADFLEYEFNGNHDSFCWMLDYVPSLLYYRDETIEMEE